MSALIQDVPLWPRLRSEGDCVSHVSESVGDGIFNGGWLSYNDDIEIESQFNVSRLRFPAVTEIIPLDLLSENQCGRVVEIAGPTGWKHRLEELGLREGAFVRVIRRGEPCILALNGQRLSLRGAVSSAVLIEVVSSESPAGLTC